jgi:hypothetical protein
MKLKLDAIPADFAVRPLTPSEAATAHDPATCGECGLTWDDGISTSWTPAPAGRCPFEYYHAEPVDPPAKAKAAKPARASYREAVQWIADNDAAGDDDPVDVLNGLISVLLVADIFRVDADKVARDVWNRRHPK